MPPRSHALALLLLCCIGFLAARVTAYGDYDDSHDDFWRDAPPSRPKPKETVDPQTGQRLVGTTIRFFQARLTPNPERTMASSRALATQMNEIFLNSGMSHNQASAGGTHVITVQTRDEWDEVKDAMFTLPDVYDVTIKEGVKLRPGLDRPYSEVWREVMGEHVPVPLQEPSPPTPQPSPRKAPKKTKKTKKSEKKGANVGHNEAVIEL